MLKVTWLTEAHLEDAARLVSNRYKLLREREPRLPHRYTEVDNLYPLLQEILNASGVGAAVIRGDRLVGFLTGWQLPAFRGQRSIFSPEWANAAEMEASQRIYEALYSQLAAVWVADKYVAHYISLFPNDAKALSAWHWMGFGMIAVDAIRSLEPIQHDAVDVHIRRAARQDIEQVIELDEALWQYMKRTPIFLLTEKRDRDYFVEWLQDSNRTIWLAERNGEPGSFIRLGPADDDVSTIIYDEKTTSIYGAFTREEVRGEGIATALLDHALKSARASGYERCAVSFEPMNLIGTRFWLKHFNPVCFSVVRQIDNRLTQA